MVTIEIFWLMELVYFQSLPFCIGPLNLQVRLVSFAVYFFFTLMKLKAKPPTRETAQYFKKFLTCEWQF
jgi:hypothetical protein